MQVYVFTIVIPFLLFFLTF